MEKNASGLGRRTRRQVEETGDRVSIGKLCASVAYHYHLTPGQVAEFSGPQLLLWLERIEVETGIAKLLDLQVSLVPHLENPQLALKDIRDSLLRMAKGEHGGD